MDHDTTMTPTARVGLRARHGLDTGMGCLAAVALRRQEEDRRAVRRTLRCLVIGHEVHVDLPRATGSVAAGTVTLR